jgi:hypothetical protein
MSLRGLVRVLLSNDTLSSQSLMPFGIAQNDTALNTTSAIPDISATADPFGDPGFIKNIPVGVEVCLTLGILYMYIHCYVGSPRQIYKEWRALRAPLDTTTLLDDQSSIASKTSMRSIDSSTLTQQQPPQPPQEQPV